MHVNKIQSVYLVANNMDALQTFYVAVLGTEPRFRDRDRWTQFAVGSTNFALSSTEEAVPGASGAVIVFEATSLEGVREQIESARGKFVNERDMGTHGTVLAFTDPEGNSFQVFSKELPGDLPAGD
jgi:predicted enzyme related to lactoylglutathione lyase